MPGNSNADKNRRTLKNDEYIILYGAGKTGRDSLELLKKIQMDDRVIGFCDRDSSKLIDDYPTYQYEDAKELSATFIVCMDNQNYMTEICSMLRHDNQKYYKSLGNFLEKIFRCASVRKNFIDKYCFNKRYFMGLCHKSRMGKRLTWEVNGKCNVIEIGNHVKLNHVFVHVIGGVLQNHHRR